MDKREPPHELNDLGPSKRTHANEDALRTTEYIHLNNGSQQRMNEQRSQNERDSQQNQNNSQPIEQFEFDRIYSDQPLPKRQFILSYEELKQMKKNNLIFHMIHRVTGIKLYFPYEELHLPQKKFIAKVYQALNTKMKLIIESSTGTGKTLSLLAGCLSWIEHSRRLFWADKVQIPQKIKNLEEANDVHIIYSSKSHSQLSQIQKQLLKLPYRPKMVLYGSRQKLCNNFMVQWKHGIKEDKYDEMKCKCNSATHYMREFRNKPQSVINQALQSSKKTIYQMVQKCFYEVNNKANTSQLKQQMMLITKAAKLYLLESKYIMNQNEKQNYQKQIKQIQRKLKNIEEKKNKQTSANMNLNQNQQTKFQIQMDKEFNQWLKNQNKIIIKEMKEKRPDIYYTNELIKKCLESKKLKQNQVKQLQDNIRQLWSMESRCHFYKTKKQGNDLQFFKFLNPGQHGTPLTIQKIKSQAIRFQSLKSTNKVCTYFHPKRIDNQGQLYLMPYNYLLDESLLPYVMKKVKNAILVFDEGHNVDKSAREGYSITFNHKMRIDGLKQIMQNQKKPKLDQDMKNADDIQIQRLQKEFMEQYGDRKIIADQIYNELREQYITRQKKMYLLNKQKEKKNRLTLKEQNKNIIENFSNNQNDPNNAKKQQQKQQIPNFKCDLTNKQLKNGLINWLIDFMRVIGQNMDKFFSIDRKVNGYFDEAINSGSDSQNCRDHAWKHTPITEEIRQWILKILFQPKRPLIEDSNQNQIKTLKILGKIIKKFQQIIQIKFAADKFNFKIKALQRFFIKLQNVLENKSYKGKYYLLLKQQTKWSKKQGRYQAVLIMNFFPLFFN